MVTCFSTYGLRAGELYFPPECLDVEGAKILHLEEATEEGGHADDPAEEEALPYARRTQSTSARRRAASPLVR